MGPPARWGRSSGSLIRLLLDGILPQPPTLPRRLGVDFVRGRGHAGRRDGEGRVTGQLLDGSTAGSAILILALVAGLGLALGSLRIRGVGLGIAGVLFAGIAFGHFGIQIEDRMRELARELGLVLFVYSIGLQVGPGFFASLRRHGLRLNLLAASIVLLGVATALVLRFAGGIEPAAVVGLLSGATTNTPSLAAAQQALKEASPDAAALAAVAKLPGLGYAVAYPFGVLGVIVVMLAVRFGFRIALEREADELDRSRAAEAPPLARANLEVANPNLVGMALEKVPLLADSGLVVSRVYQDGTLQVPRPDTRLKLGDVLLAVGRREDLDALRVVVGRESTLDLRSLPSAITAKRLIVTRTSATGRTIGELDFVRRFGVQITRVSRAELEMPPTPGFELQYGDTVLAVGEKGDLQKVGGGARRLAEEPQLPAPGADVPGHRARHLRRQLAVLAARRAGAGQARPRRRAAASSRSCSRASASSGRSSGTCRSRPTTRCARPGSCSSSAPSAWAPGTSSWRRSSTATACTGWPVVP